MATTKTKSKAKPKAKAKRKRKGGRPAYKPTPAHREIVKVAAAMGFTQVQICKLIRHGPKMNPITVPTLKKYFARQLADGSLEANFTVGSKLFELATKKDNLGAMVFWLKNRAGWSDARVLKGEGPNESIPITGQVTVVIPDNGRDTTEG